MEELLTYLLKSSGLTLMFFLAYHFLLRKETFFNTNRWFLLSGLVTSVILPLFFIKKIVFVETQKIVSNAISNTNFKPVLTENTIENTTINWFEISLYLYITIAIILFFKIIYDLFSLMKVFENKEITIDKNFKVIDTKQNIAPFSFFNYIVLNSSLYTQAELESILLHEKIHSSQKHSIDVLITNLFTVIFWFNPILYWYKKAVIQNLEYIADSEAIAQIEDKKSYQMALLKVVSNQNCLPITNHFYQSLIKKRIVMLNKNQSQKRNSWKYAVILPALIGFVMLFQIKVIAQEREIKLEDGSTISSTTREVTEMNWDKNTSDEEFKNDIKSVKKAKIKLDISKVKRNSKGEITSITINIKDELNNNLTETYSDTNGIEPIHFIRDIDQKGKGRIGFVKDNKYSSNQKKQAWAEEVKESDEIIAEAVLIENDENFPIQPTPPIAPTAPEIKVNSIPVPNFPTAPKAPIGSPITNEKEWKKFEKKMEEFEKKMEAIEPEMEAYSKQMFNIDEQMKPFEEEMKKFETKMKLFEEEMKIYEMKIKVYLETQKSK
ncbi:M56 family metallopeptidase [Flavobacterium sp.]|uniref:M56 family metallopeptidase n=1 Tax=Flavobacterium sp. TaxID=239 RepID=UPI003751A187